MAAPGYSVADLIKAATTCKHVYDAFFSKYDNAHNRVTELHNTVSLFQGNLLAHAEILERSGKHYPGFEDFERTIFECDEFLQKYRRRLSTATGTGRGKIRAALNTAAWPFEDKHVERLTRRLNLQIQALNSFALTVLLEQLSHGDEEPHPAPEPIATGQAHQQHPPTSVIRQNLLNGRAPLMLEQRRSSASSEESLQALMVRATTTRNQIKRREIEALQRVRNRKRRSGSASGGSNAVDQMQLSIARDQYQHEARELVRDWRRIAVRNGVSEDHLPEILDSQPLEMAEEYWKRALQASKMAARAPLTPMASPNLSEWDGGFSEHPAVNVSASRPQSIESPGSPDLLPGSASLLSASPPDTIFTHRTKNSSNTATPNSLGLLDPRRRPSSFLGDLSLGLPAVIDCEAELTLRNRAAKYPALKIKRLEVHQLDGTCDIYCTTTTPKGDLRIVHKIPRGHGTHPFTKHRCHNKPFEVSFLESHRVVHEARTYTGDPHYRFISEEDCKLFQSSIRGKDLVHVWDVDKVAFKTSDQLGDATDEHLKIWRDFDGGRFTLSFFANNPSDQKGRRHREFRLALLTIPAGGGRTRPGVIKLDLLPIKPAPRRPSKADARRESVDKAVGPDTPPRDPHGRTGSRSGRLGTASTSPRIDGNYDTNPTTPRSPSTAFGWTVGRVQTISTLASEEPGPSRPNGVQAEEGDEDTTKLKFMEITFSEPADADRFMNLFHRVFDL